jgi:tetratricopeptide (TPR) repeat protein
LPLPVDAANFAARSPDASQVQAMVAQLEKQLAAQPGNPALIFQLVQAYQQLQQPTKTLPLLESLLANPQADLNSLLFAANGFNQLGQPARVEESLARLVKLAPDYPEAWFDLAGIQAALGKKTEAIASLTESLKRSAQRFAKDPKAVNLYSNALTDARFNVAGFRQSPEFQKLLAEQKPASK